MGDSLLPVIRHASAPLAAGLAAGIAFSACAPSQLAGLRTGSASPTPRIAGGTTPSAGPTTGVTAAPGPTPSPGATATAGPTPTATPTFGPAGEPGTFISFGPALDTGAIRRIVVSALGTPSLDPGQSLTLQATGYTSLGVRVDTIWAWTQVGGGTGWPSDAANPFRGSFCCRARDKIVWITDRGRARSGTVTVTARAGNGTAATFPITVRNVPPVFDAASASPVVAGDPTGTALTVAAAKPIVLEARFHDDNGALEDPVSGEQWVFDVATDAGYDWKGAWTWDGGIWQTDSPLRVSASASITFSRAGTASVTWTFKDGATNRLVRSWNLTIQ